MTNPRVQPTPDHVVDFLKQLQTLIDAHTHVPLMKMAQILEREAEELRDEVESAGTPSRDPVPDPAGAVWRHGEIELRWKYRDWRKTYILYIGGLRIGRVIRGLEPDIRAGMWRAEIDTFNVPIGQRDTEQEAKDLLVDHVVRLIRGDDDGR